MNLGHALAAAEQNGGSFLDYMKPATSPRGLPAFLNLQGRNVYTGNGENGNHGERNVACACNHDGDNTALMSEMVLRYNSHAALVAALNTIAGRVNAVNGPQFDRLETAQDYAAFILDYLAKGGVK
jgi:hypothetical protein